ncbi:hypothetical protein DICVIV_00647 [Dictyocaulus viviparus]|uniref:Uncharacterized protein n=1 Tax=Dictyocaulus viviparus TaxID=29172 RepID=A0A0D8YAU4_DICVI|nr:hypothetical protein DICVIV_00647 [Dictyocaulus viviparus]
MFSSDDDEPLAVIASKAKRGRVHEKKRRETSKKSKRIKNNSDTESISDDDKNVGRVRKKKKQAFKNELDNDEVTYGSTEKDSPTKANEKIAINDEDSRIDSCGGLVVTEEVDGSTLDYIKMDEASPNTPQTCAVVSKNCERPATDHEKVEELNNLSSLDCGEDNVLKEKNESSDSSLEDFNKNQEIRKEKNESSDSSLEGCNKNQEIRKRRRSERTSVTSSDEGSSKKKFSDKKARKQKEQSQDGASIRLTRLKKMVTLAGLRIVYKKFFEGVADNDRSRVKALEKEMERRAPFTMEACKAFKVQKEQEAELAELSKNYIIEIGENQKGRVTRGQRSAALAFKCRGGLVFENTSDEDEEEVEEREHMKQETQNMFKNLRGIVSDDADSD